MTDRNYVAAWHDYSSDRVIVLERDSQGALFKKAWAAPYYFFIPDPEGTYLSIAGEPLSRVEYDSREAFDSARRHWAIKFESDISPLKRVLMDNYYGRAAPPVNYAFIDIEVDYRQEHGFSSPTNPYAEINAVTIYQSWSKKFILAAVPPRAWAHSPERTTALLTERFDQLVAAGSLRPEHRPDFVVCKSELELVQHLLEAVQDADIISGWNSEFFDLPYICERLLLLGGAPLLRQLDHAGVRAPKKEMVNRYGSEEPVYRLTGRCHLDYMRLFQKFTFEGRTSYSLGNILQEEVGVGKLEYDGTLEQLYNNDFILFALYNFRDVDGLVQLDEKFKFIALANQMAHENTVLFDAVLGTVSYVETGVANHAHYKLGRRVHDKVITENERVEGAIVMTPKVGLHEWVGSVDINSLYPNTIRSLNISPEKIIGQFPGKELAWSEVRARTQTRLPFVFEGGESVVASAEEWHDLFKEQRWAISAYGTVFDQSTEAGLIPDILAFWYAERKRLQAEKKRLGKEVSQLREQLALKIVDD